MEWHFQSARSAVVARDPVLEVIHRYKYQRALWFEPFLAELLIRAASPALAAQRPSMIVPVPLHPAKRREREFNQAERLAARLSAATQIPVNKRLLQRVVPTRTQTQLSRPERLRHAAGPAPERRAHCAGGRRVYDGGDDQRLCQGAGGCRGGGSLRLDSCARNLNIIRLTLRVRFTLNMKSARRAGGPRRSGLDPQPF
jgi:hypothetical protein